MRPHAGVAGVPTPLRWHGATCVRTDADCTHARAVRGGSLLPPSPLPQPVVGMLAPGLEGVEQRGGVGMDGGQLELRGAQLGLRLAALAVPAIRAGMPDPLGRLVADA